MLIIISLLSTLIVIATGVCIVVAPQDNWMIWPKKWLIGTPFDNMMIPGLVFLTFIGIVNGWGVWNLFREHPKQFDRVMPGGYLFISWIVVEILLSRELYLIHVSMILMASLQILLAYQQKEKWAV
jgi:hypothetical protein